MTAKPAKPDEPAPRFFASRAAFRRWLEVNHAKAPSLWIGFRKAHVAKRGLTYTEAVEEALCFGWIDGLVKRIDDDSFRQRYTPRRPGSIWSAVNIRRVAALEAAGRLALSGRAAFAGRDPKRAGLYSFESPEAALPGDSGKRFRANKAAWKWFAGQAPSYRKAALHWVMGAKREETRERRLARLIDDSAGGLRLAHLTGNGKARS